MSTPFRAAHARSCQCTASDASDVNNFISQDIDIQACASGVDAGEIRVDATGWFIGEQAPDWDDHRMWVVFKDEAGGPIDSYDSGVRRSVEWEQYGPLHNRSVAHPFLLAAFHSKFIGEQ